MARPRHATAWLAWLLVPCAIGCKDGGREAGGGASGPRGGVPPVPADKPVLAAEPADAGSGGAAAWPAETARADPRQELLRREWERYADVVVEHDVADLPEPERVFARRLVEAAALAEEIHLLQIHPSNPEWRDAIEREGTELERRLFHRYQSPWCLDDPDPGCNVLPGLPPREYGRGLWPGDLGRAEAEGLGRLINGRELLSPYTVVERGGDGRLRAVPFAAAAHLGPSLARLAAKLREAAESAPHPSLKRFLASRADAFESRDPFPCDGSDGDWLRIQGPWDAWVGPAETYDCPHGIKAMFQMWAGRVVEGPIGEFRIIAGDPDGLKAALAALLGREAYEGRVPDPRLAPRAVDVWVAAGDARRERGAILACHLPSRGPASRDGRGRSVLFVNHVAPFFRADRELAGRALAAGQAPLGTADAALANLALHELGHGFGLAPESRIVDLQGRPTSLQEALREHALLVEELKADALGKWLAGFARARDAGDAAGDGGRSRWIATVAGWLGLLRGPLTGVHARMAAVELGWHLEAGALSWDPATSRLAVDFGRADAAAEALAAEVLAIQMSGDRARARALVERFVDAPGSDGPAARGALAAIRAAVTGPADGPALRPPVLRYTVRDAESPAGDPRRPSGSGGVPQVPAPPRPGTMM